MVDADLQILAKVRGAAMGAHAPQTVPLPRTGLEQCGVRFQTKQMTAVELLGTIGLLQRMQR